MKYRRRTRYYPSHIRARIVAIAYAAMGLGLIIQPSRFSATPAYHNLIRWAPAQAWGVAYLFAAALLGLWILRPPRLAIAMIAYTFAIALTLLWLMAFVIRYATDSHTTAVNVVTWAVYLSLLVRSATDAFDDDEPKS